MKILKLIGLLIIIAILILAGILNFTKTELTVENAEFNENYENIYPSSCFIKFENKKFLVQEIYKYKHKILNEYWFVASEGFAIQKFEFPFEMNYNNEQKKYRILKYTENEKLVKFNSQEYKITEKRNDTIISKITENKVIIFIDKE
ncbi:hypothetical protein [Flavobacterium celericrescens]|uniref:Uncharacterized protein n=1 Tax=Flavobacterium celericrescens TaxID=2709780 RepID=A0ABX0IAL4_9FLAO|nr:hypothetical protein [Flavobacterium celericrescens]NHM03677.1 hypothetical protein [Flavobacterium celericrescens]